MTSTPKVKGCVCVNPLVVDASETDRWPFQPIHLLTPFRNQEVTNNVCMSVSAPLCLYVCVSFSPPC